jgi:hypothetical protein
LACSASVQVGPQSSDQPIDAFPYYCRIGNFVVAGLLCLKLLGCATKTAPIKSLRYMVQAGMPGLQEVREMLDAVKVGY